MGTLYFVACDKCKVYRDLDKFYTMSNGPINTRSELEKFSEEIKKDSFRSAILISFMWKHESHNCFIVYEHSARCEELYESFTEVDEHFWKNENEENQNPKTD